jgi:hypothetical protein
MAIVTPSATTCSFKDLEYSTLKSLRAGFIPSLFLSSASSRFKSLFTYAGRMKLRGVPCDTWTSSLQWRANSGVNYTFTSSMHFYPLGWQFPGRSGADGKRVLMRVLNRGVMNVLADFVETYPDIPPNAPYVDTWDFFKFLPVTLEASVFEPPAECAKPPGFVAKLSGPDQAKFIVIIVAVLTAALVVGLMARGVYLEMRKRKKKQAVVNASDSSRSELTGPQSVELTDVDGVEVEDDNGVPIVSLDSEAGGIESGGRDINVELHSNHNSGARFSNEQARYRVHDNSDEDFR